MTSFPRTDRQMHSINEFNVFISSLIRFFMFAVIEWKSFPTISALV